MMKKPAYNESSLDWIDRHYYVFVAAGFIISFGVSFLFTEATTAAFIAFLVADPVASLIMMMVGCASSD